jgi:hypothetical protein
VPFGVGFLFRVDPPIAVGTISRTSRPHQCRQDSVAPQGIFWGGGTGPNQLFQSIKRASAAIPGRPAGRSPAGTGEGGRPGDEKSSSSSFLFLGPSAPTNWENRSPSLYSPRAAKMRTPFQAPRFDMQCQRREKTRRTERLNEDGFQVRIYCFSCGCGSGIYRLMCSRYGGCIWSLTDILLSHKKLPIR